MPARGKRSGFAYDCGAFSSFSNFVNRRFFQVIITLLIDYPLNLVRDNHKGYFLHCFRIYLKVKISHMISTHIADRIAQIISTIRINTQLYRFYLSDHMIKHNKRET